MNVLRVYGVVGLLIGASCSGAEAPQLESREADAAECSDGGIVLSVDGQVEAIVCNGERGETGAPGEPGASGVDGADGADATEGGVIRDTLYCRYSEDTTRLSVYLWSVPGVNSALDNIGFCRLGEANFVDADALIGTRCSLFSPTKGVVEIVVNPTAGTATVAGDIVGVFECS